MRKNKFSKWDILQDNWQQIQFLHKLLGALVKEEEEGGSALYSMRFKCLNRYRV